MAAALGASQAAAAPAAEPKAPGEEEDDEYEYYDYEEVVTYEEVEATDGNYEDVVVVEYEDCESDEEAPEEQGPEPEGQEQPQQEEQLQEQGRRHEALVQHVVEKPQSSPLAVPAVRDKPTATASPPLLVRPSHSPSTPPPPARRPPPTAVPAVEPAGLESTLRSKKRSVSVPPKKLKQSGGGLNFSGLRIEFVGDTQEARAALFESFRKTESIRCGTELFGRVEREECDCFVCPCSSSLGPLWPQYSTASDALSRLEKKYPGTKERVTNVIIEEYLGEVPVGTSFLMELSPTFQVCFVTLASTTAVQGSFVEFAYAYSGFRSAMIEIALHNRKNPGKEIVEVVWPLFPCIGFLENQPYEVVRQIAIARRQLLFGTGDVDVRAKELIECPLRDEEVTKRIFVVLASSGELPERGLYSMKELEWLMAMVSDPTDAGLQLQAAKCLAEFMRADKRQLPTDISKQQVCERVLGAWQNNDSTCANCMLYMMQFAQEGKVFIHNEIQSDDLETLESIGKGATANVYRAVYKGVHVAYKEFYEGVDMTEFYKEVAMMSLLFHPNLVRMLGAGIKDGKYAFIVTEIIENGSLHDMIFQKSRPYNFNEVLTWALDTAKGMRYLHKMGIIHRDLKSLNLLITSDLHCKVTDYGASRLIDAGATMTGNIGTAAWMAPEVFNAKNYTEKADVYSFAMCLYEMVTQLQPFHEISSFQIPVHVTKGGRPTIPKEAPKPWVKIMKECWHAKPDRRPSFVKIISMLEALRP